VANRWLHTHRGLVTGIFAAANATGQLIFLPVIAYAVERDGWRSAAGIVGVLALVLRGRGRSGCRAGQRPTEGVPRPAGGPGAGSARGVRSACTRTRRKVRLGC
jgi:MFS family permease